MPSFYDTIWPAIDSIGGRLPTADAIALHDASFRATISRLDGGRCSIKAKWRPTTADLPTVIIETYPSVGALRDVLSHALADLSAGARADTTERIVSVVTSKDGEDAISLSFDVSGA